jgi:hypothetical protein
VTVSPKHNEKWNPDKYIEILQGALDAYENEHPHWKTEVLISFIRRGLTGLRQQIEDRTNDHVTWDSPFVDFQYPVEWDWNVRDVRLGKLLSGILTSQNTRDLDTARVTLSEMMVRHLNTLALQELTNGVWLEQKGKGYSVFLPPKLNDELRAARGERQRRELLQEFSHPFSIGAASIDFGELKGGQRISKQAARQLAEIDKLIAIRRIGFSGDINGRRIEMWLVFQIHPLTIDYERKKAFHLITVGLFTPPEVAGNDIITRTPSDWPHSDIESLWTEIFREVGKIADYLIPKRESQTSEILVVNARLEIPLASSSPEERNAARKKIMDALSQGGLVKEISMTSPESNAVSNSIRSLAEHENAPATPTEGVMRLIWNSRFRWPAIILLAIASVAVLLYEIQPDEAKVTILKSLGFHSLR